jgi:phenylalanyl-tRNA synthetase beta chain
VDKPVSAGEIGQIIRQAGGPLLKKTALYDHFEGKKLEPGKKSLTFALTFQSPDRTLTDEEVNPVFEKIVQQLVEKVQAHLREA